LSWRGVALSGAGTSRTATRTRTRSCRHGVAHSVLATVITHAATATTRDATSDGTRATRQIPSTGHRWTTCAVAQHDLPAGRCCPLSVACCLSHVARRALSVACCALRRRTTCGCSRRRTGLRISWRAASCAAHQAATRHIIHATHNAAAVQYVATTSAAQRASAHLAAALCDGCATLCGRAMGSSICCCCRAALHGASSCVVASAPVYVGRWWALHVARLQ
jgi:hypothetical protein